MELKVGLTCAISSRVDQAKTACVVGSGALEVYATPMMAALMEAAAAGAIQPALEPGQTSVGTALHIAHTSATPVGMRVSATATVTAVEGKRVEFALSASDEAGEIGSGTHTRFVVDKERFLQKANGKLQP